MYFKLFEGYIIPLSCAQPREAAPQAPTKSFSRRIAAFDGLRGVAALYIVWGHICGKFMTLLPSLKAFSWLIRHYNFAVCLFFLISGFLTMLASEKITRLTPKSYLNFISNRFLRLYPAYLVALLLVVAMASCARLARWPMQVPASVVFPWSSLPMEFFMVQHWQPGLVSWNYPAWSISVLWWCSLFLFPVLFGIVRKVTDWRPLAFLLVFLTGAYACIRSQYPTSDLGNWIFLISRVIFPFAIGSILFAFWRRGKLPPRWVANLGGATGLAGFFGAHYFCPGMGLGATAIVIVSLMLILLSAGCQESFLSTAMETPLFVSLGKASYSIYLSHSITERIASGLMPPEHFANASMAVRVLVFLGYIMILGGGAAGFYYIIDRPCQKLYRTWTRKPVLS